MSLKLERFTTGYRQFQVGPVDLEIPEHQLFALIGPNGAGKSTLLKGVLGLIQQAGRFSIGEKDFQGKGSRARTKEIAYLPQRHHFTYPVSVEDVVLMGFNPQMSLLAHYSQRQKSAVGRILQQLNLSELAQHDINRLSEGQRQRVMLARSLVSHASVLLLDEPDSALDFSVRQDILMIIQQQIRSESCCGLAVLHDPALALKHCDQIAIMDQGLILSVIDPMRDALAIVQKKLQILYPRIEVYRTPKGQWAVEWPIHPGPDNQAGETSL